MRNHRFTRLILTVLAVCLLTIPAVLADSGNIPQRADVEDQYKWKLDDIYPDLGSWEADYAFIEQNLSRFDQFKGQLDKSADNLLTCLKLQDTLGIIVDKMFVYAYMKLDEDSRVSEYQELAGRISNLDASFRAATSFIQPEIITFAGDRLNKMLNTNPELDIYRFYFSDLERQKKHILSKEEEALLANVAPLAQAPADIFGMIDNADIKLGSIINDDGEKVDLTWGRYSQIMKNGSREVRRAANDTVQTQYLKYINTLAATYGGSLKRDLFFANTRGYNSCLEYSLEPNNIPTEVVHSLVKAVNENMDTFHKLSALRKKVLGYDTLYTYDNSVPLGPKSDKTYTYEEAKQILLEGLKPLGDKYISDLNNAFNSGWVDVYETEGKATGAYSWGSYATHPYILMNFTGQLSDVFTLAHEFGHALNGYYATANEHSRYYDQTLFTAEVASTTNEAILMKYLMSQAKDKNERMALLNQYINQIDGTFFTQVMFCEFELAAHERVESGGATSVDFFRKTYRDIFQKYMGDDVVIGPNNDMGGLKISHFYRQYYVYQYATCYAAAQLISQKIMEGDKQALADYMDFLATGSSDYPVEILKKAGVDLTKPDAFYSTIKLFGELVDQMAALVDEG